jgi:excinuclease ABC subunit C
MEEVQRVQRFLETRGMSLKTEVETARDAASIDLKFEEAAALHNRSEKVKEAVRGFDEIIRRIDKLDAVILQRSAQAGHLAVFRFSAGQLLGPCELPVKVAEKETIAEQKQRLLDSIASLNSDSAADAHTTTEHLSILKRWYYSSRRVGEIFFPHDDGSWPMQKMINAVVRIAE